MIRHYPRSLQYQNLYISEYYTQHQEKTFSHQRTEHTRPCPSEETLLQWNDFDNPDTTEEYVKQWCEKQSYGLGNVMNPFRLMLVGELKGPHMFEVTAVLGKEETIRRMDVALEKLPTFA